MGRGAALLLLCIAIAGCGERDFDERFSEQEQALASEAAALEAELDRRMVEKPGLEATTGESADGSESGETTPANPG